MKKIIFFLLFCSFLQLQAQKNLALRSVLKYPTRTSACWGYTAPNNKEYAIVGLETGVSIVDITNPDTITELFNIVCPTSIWREMKTFGEYAYVTNEQDSGLLIIDLRQLPNNISTKYWRANELFQTAHSIFIDENGVAYLNGFSDRDRVRPSENRGILFADVATDPWNPILLGTYEAEYVHDCFARNDTLWAAAINNGWFSVLDVQNKNNAILMAQQATPSNFTHNCWLSDNGKYLFTTDERAGSNIASYDVSDLSNIQLLDKYRTTVNTAVIAHNVHVKQNFLVNAYYKDGVTIVDATKPDNLIEIGNFDTSPFLSEDGFSGCWAVYPYYPSNTIIATDIEEGLFVLTPEYTQACYLEGTITNADNNVPVSNVRVEIMGKEWFEFTDITGIYKTGIVDSGTYDVRFFVAGCETEIVQNVELKKGQTTILNVALNCPDFNSVVEKNNPIHFNITPNIFKNNTLLKFDLKNKNALGQKILITDISGKLVNEILINETLGNMMIGNNLSAGLYVVSLVTQEYIETQKMIKIE